MTHYTASCAPKPALFGRLTAIRAGLLFMLLIILSGPLSAWNKEQGGVLYDHHASCSNYIDAYQIQKKELDKKSMSWPLVAEAHKDFEEYFHYLLGVVSAYNYYKDNGLSNVMETPLSWNTLYAFIEFYCKKQPNASVWRATAIALEQLCRGQLKEEVEQLSCGNPKEHHSVILDDIEEFQLSPLRDFDIKLYLESKKKN